jgi:hypothetical protein
LFCLILGESLLAFGGDGEGKEAVDVVVVGKGNFRPTFLPPPPSRVNQVKDAPRARSKSPPDSHITRRVCGRKGNYSRKAHEGEKRERERRLASSGYGGERKVYTYKARGEEKRMKATAGGA